jgi:polyphosphate glucokinase
MRRLPLSHPVRDLGIVLRQLAKLSQDILLRGACRFRDERRGAEELTCGIATALHLQDPSHLAALGDVQGDEHDHPSRQHATEGEKMWAHAPKVPTPRVQRKQSERDALRRRSGAVILPGVKILVIDIGGSHVKLLASGRRTPVKVPSGPTLTPGQMVAEVLEATEGWSYDVVSIGYPGPVARNRPTKEPANLGDGWTRFNFQRAFGCPVRMINDAAMQALGSYAGKTMLFLGLGTGLGNTLVTHGVVVPMEMGHLPYANGKTYEDIIGEAGLRRMGKRKWRQHVHFIVELLASAMNADYTVLGGGNVRFMDALPTNTRRGNNANAFRGGYRLWDDAETTSKRR